jgi:hypothetical protein
VRTAEKAVAVDSISAYAATFWKLKYESSGLSAICVRSDDIPRYAWYLAAAITMNEQMFAQSQKFHGSDQYLRPALLIWLISVRT